MSLNVVKMLTISPPNLPIFSFTGLARIHGTFMALKLFQCMSKQLHIV